MARSRKHYEKLVGFRRRRVKELRLIRAALVGLVVIVGYYVLPMTEPGIGAIVLVVGLLVLAGVLAWQIREILDSLFPRVRAFQTLLVGIPLLLCVFASAYFVIGRAQPGSFTQPMNKVGAMYFTVSVLSTVGFGDITARTDLARSLVTAQMILNLVVLGLVIRVLSTTVTVGLQRQSAKLPSPGPESDSPTPATQLLDPDADSRRFPTSPAGEHRRPVPEWCDTPGATVTIAGTAPPTTLTTLEQEGADQCW